MARIDALEIRIAYQDETIETLNKTITEQWRKLDALGNHIFARWAGAVRHQGRRSPDLG